MFGSPSFARLSPLLLLVAAAIAVLLNPAAVPQYYLYLCNVIMMYAVLAIGLDLLLGWAGQFAFAHIAFFGIGVYGTALFQLRLDLPWIVAVVAASALAGVVGFLIAIPATRLRAVYLALATFAFAEGAQWVFNAWESMTNGPDGLRLPRPSLFGYEMGGDPTAFPVIAILLGLVLAATMFLTRSKFGRSMCAIRDSEHAAAASGIDVRFVKVVVFSISAVYAGIAGGMYTLFQSFANPEVFGFGQIVLVLSMVVVGGLGTIPGVLIGTVILGLLPEVMRTAMRSLLVWQELVYGVILILAMMFMPRGLWGLLRPKRKGVKA